MSKAIVHKVPKEQQCLSVDTMKVPKSTLKWLHENDYKTILDVIIGQKEIPNEHRGKIYAYLIFGIEYK